LRRDIHPRSSVDVVVVVVVIVVVNGDVNEH